MAPRTVADIMTTKVVTLDEEDNLQGVAKAMDDFKIRHVPVVDGKKLVGLISQRDVLRLAVSSLTKSTALEDLQKHLESDSFVADVMTRDPITVSPATAIPDLIRLLLQHRVGAFPVVDGNGELVGIVSEIDVLAAAEKMF